MVFEEILAENLIEEISMGPFGSNIKKECFTDSGVAVLNGSNLVGFSLNEDTFGYVTEEKADSLGKANASRGDVVITHRGTLGQAVFIPQNSTRDRYVISQSQFRVRCNERILPEYMVYYLHTPQGRHKLLANASQVGVPALARATSTFKKIVFEVPDIKYQEKVVSFLELIRAKIEKNSAINNNLYHQLDTIYQSIYPYLPSDELPDGWTCVPVGTLCDSISVKHSFDKENLIFLNTGDIENGQFLHETYSLVADMPGQAKKSIKVNDILYSEIRPINRHFAFVNFNADDYVVSTKLMVIRAYNINARRLYHFLTMQETIRELQIEAESRSGTFPQIRFENVQRLPIVIAPPDVELQFAHILEDYYKMIDSNIRQNQQLITLRDNLLSKLMSGEIDVSDIQL